MQELYEGDDDNKNNFSDEIHLPDIKKNRKKRVQDVINLQEKWPEFITSFIQDTKD